MEQNGYVSNCISIVTRIIYFLDFYIVFILLASNPIKNVHNTIEYSVKSFELLNF